MKNKISTILIIIIFGFSAPAFSKELMVKLVGISHNGKDTKLSSLRQITLLPSHVKKTLADYGSRYIIKFDATGLSAGEKINFIVDAPGWQVLHPYNLTTYLPKNLNNDVISIKMVTNTSKLTLGNLESSFLNTGSKVKEPKLIYVQAYAHEQVVNVTRAQSMLISRGFTNVKYRTEETITNDEPNTIVTMHKVIIGPFDKWKQAEKVIKSINRISFFKEQKPYIRRY